MNNLLASMPDGYMRLERLESALASAKRNKTAVGKRLKHESDEYMGIEAEIEELSERISQTKHDLRTIAAKGASGGLPEHIEGVGDV